MSSIVALFLVLTFAASLVALPIANAHTPPWQIPTWSYVAVTNSVIGVNQPFTIVYWPNAYPPTAIGAYGDRWTWTIEVTKPDGSKETLGPYISDPVGGGWTTYTPSQTGTYTIVAKMAEHKIDGSPNGFAPGYGPASFGYTSINDTYLASESEPVTVTVQEEPIQPWPESPLPSQYWTRPIYSASRNWYVLAGNWLAGGAQNWPIGSSGGTTSNFAFGKGPETPHVMWATPMWSGGIMDERFGDTGFQTAHYEGLSFTPPIILDGRIYYNVQSLPRMGWYCLDLYTGETLYFHNTTGPVTGIGGGFDASGAITGESLAFGQIYNYDSPNQHGGFPYLWSTTVPGQPNTWMMFDAYSGNYICSIKNVPASASPQMFFGYGVGGMVYGKDGSILSYSITGTGANKRLLCWNTSKAIWYEPVWRSNEYWMWRPTQNMAFDGNNGYSLNASIPDVAGTIRAVREDKYIIGGTSGKNNGTFVQQGHLWALNLKPDANGRITPTLLWNITFTPPQTVVPDVVTGGLFGGGTMQGPTVYPEYGVFVFSEGMTRRWWGYSLETGQLLWGPTAPEPAMNFYGMYSNVYQGMLLSTGYSGVLYAYDLKTGKVLWNYTAQQVGYESPYGNYPIGIVAIADGKIYLTSSEHSPTQPLWRGSYLRCINASNGVELWKVLNWGAGMGPGSGAAIADGFIVSLDLYDNRIYCYGKGPSTITVSAPQTVITEGQSVMITGTVTDQSPAAQKIAKEFGFANGVPAVSDASMQEWMEYLYKDQIMPNNVQGVEVILDTLDPNGNFIHIGTATTDASGTFGYKYTPEVPGTYKIIATFAGTNGYYGSFAETYIGVDAAPPPTPPTEFPQPIDYTMHFVAVAIAIIIAIAIAVILLKKL